MNARDNILARLRAVKAANSEQPQVDAIKSISFEDRVAHFTEVVRSVGGEVVEQNGSLEATLATLLNECVTLVSPLAELQGKALNPDEVADVHELGGEYTAVVCGEVGVAENGAVWVPVEGRRKAHLFACKHLVILLDKECVVDTMHDAMKRVSLDKLAYGAFVSGPSKTADIEQALVMGAHGAMKATVILY
jgi:L-lactate dehydrogenase complex protein LldG